ncbi:uncharacterized protein LOC120090699 [Benincasa hispida]|uniref:uncharacterized protein LOC120090699 n=1 Tax=Benincasa hispida TaxID=102211 RepID=UPI00190283BF|nr:uncharacterized protein LOC120090699 [Benincasa hispida]
MNKENTEFRYDPEIERTFWRRNKSNCRRRLRQQLLRQQERERAMAEEQQKQQLAHTAQNPIQMTAAPFRGSGGEDPHAHMKCFLETCNSFVIPGITPEAIRLSLFPYSLRDDAKHWMKTFYGGLNRASQMAADAATAGGLMDKSYTEAKEILDRIAKHNMEWVDDTYDGRYDRRTRSQNINSVDANAIATLSAQMATMTNLLQNFTLGNAQNQQKVNQMKALGQLGEEINKSTTQARAINKGMDHHLSFNKRINNSSIEAATHRVLEKPIEGVYSLERRNAEEPGVINQKPGTPGGVDCKRVEKQAARHSTQNTETPRNNNRKEQCHAVTLRSGRALAERKMNPRNNSPSKECITCTMDQEERTPENTSHLETSTSNVGKKEVLLNAPFPRRLMKKNDEHQFKHFLELLKQLHINIPLIEALEQMPTYVKFLKDILTKKRKVRLDVDHALCDLGASIEAKPTSVTLQLADRTTKYPKGKIEDVLVKVDNLIFPADYVILDYEADREVPIILGRPFLATGKVLIDMHKGELTMRMANEEVTFNVLNALKFPDTDDCPLNHIELTEEETRVCEVIMLEGTLKESELPSLSERQTKPRLM